MYDIERRGPTPASRRSRCSSRGGCRWSGRT
jgi:hypothetical protein